MDKLVSATGGPYMPPPLPDTDTSFWTMCKDIMFKDAPRNVYETFLDTVIRKHAHHGHLHRLTIEETAALVLYTWDFHNQPRISNPHQRLNKECAERSLDALLLPFYWNLVSAYDQLPKVKVDKLYRGLSSGIVSTAGGAPPTYRAGKDVCIVAFTSTSKRREKAKGFMPSSSGGGTLVMYERCEGVELKPFSIYPEEDEVLLCPNRLFHVTSILTKDQVSSLFDTKHDLVILSDSGHPTTTSTHSKPCNRVVLRTSDPVILRVPDHNANAHLLHHELTTNPKNMTAWSNMGSLLQEIEYYRNGTVYDPEATQTILGVTYTSRGCYEKCVECDDTNSMGWMMLGRFGKGGTVHGKKHGWDECCEKAVTICPSGAMHWNVMGCLGGGKVSGMTYDAKECFVKALEIASDSWNACQGIRGPGSNDSTKGIVKALEIDPSDSTAWNELGTLGGGTVSGVAYDKKMCYVKALENDPKFAAGWFNLGTQGGGTVLGVSYDKKTCYVKALENDPKHSYAWYNLGTQAGGTVLGVSYDKRACYVRTLENDPKNTKAWHDLGTEGGGTVLGVAYDKKMCYIKGLEIDPKFGAGWFNLGTQGGGTVLGVSYDKRACYVRALEIDPKHSYAWYNLGTQGGGIVSGVSIESKTCNVKALEIDPKLSLVWTGLGNQGGGVVSGAVYDAKACYVNALESDSKSSKAWTGLGAQGGGIVLGVLYDAKACYVKALEIDPKSSFAWNGLASQGGGIVSGVEYDAKTCSVRALEGAKV